MYPYNHDHSHNRNRDRDYDTNYNHNHESRVVTTQMQRKVDMYYIDSYIRITLISRQQLRDNSDDSSTDFTGILGHTLRFI